MYLTGPLFLVTLIAMMIWPVLKREEKLRDVFAETMAFLKSSAVVIITSLVIFSIVWVTLYTSLFTHTENWFAVQRALDYWSGQQNIKRIGGPWHYYVSELILYEPLITFPALAAALMILVQRPSPDRFTRFTCVWALGTLAIYSWAQEKVPWLLIPQLLPMTLLAARWFGRMIERGRLGAPAVAIPLTAVSALTIWSLIAANYLYDAPRTDQPKDQRRETMLSYVQSTYDVTELVMPRIESIAAAQQTGLKTRLAISGDATWPFSWYVRHYPVNWGANLRNVDHPVLIVDKKLGPAHDEALSEHYDKIPFQVRGWWEPKFRPGNPTLQQFFRWLLYRDAWSPLGSSDAILYARKNVEVGKTTYAMLQVNPPPSARGYPRAPDFVEATAIWGGVGSAEGQFREPRAMATDKQGNLFIVDTKNNRIQKLGPAGKTLATWGGEGQEPGKFKDPHGIAIGPDGSVYVADTWNHRIQKFDSNGAFLLEWNASDQSFWGPRGVAAADSGNVYVTDTGNKRIVYFSPDGIQIDTWGGDGSGAGQLIEPVGIAISEAGEIIVADTGNRRLQFFQEDGVFVKEWKVFGWEEFYSEPYLATFGPDVYMTDSHEHRFASYRDGKLQGVWGKTGSSSGEFNRPIGIAINSDGRVFVSDTFNNRIQVFDLPAPDLQVGG
jgi:sugar lactone lactonase YvrE